MLLRHRHRSAIKKVLKYGGCAVMVCLCGIIICFPELFVKQLFPPLTSSVEDTPRDAHPAADRTTLLASDTTQTNYEQLRMAAAFRKLSNFLFLSTERKCENLFAQTRHGPKLTYSASYWDYVDSYKNALSAAGVLKEGRTNEESWTIHEIAKSSFVRTVCLTGFNGGLSAFMCLTANPNLKVYAFDEQRYNYTKELATFMSWEFYDRLTITFGDTRHTITEFVTARPAFRCDMFIVDGSRSREKLEGDFKDVARLVNPAGNIVVVELYATNNAARVWESYKERGDVKEHFMCKFNELDVLSVRSRSHMGFAVGSYVNK
ncbi:hypothetical protein NP493_55g08002 [Ridgeia piscesae]|uniref:Methyltransferase n=1 Tax=Ridgeia piscesae TaxID=27915 RepID=A0AAD9UJ46_RIDPI|nr:hypothetical protein NP493_55g08002 [Ridgeia piscesae]